MHRPQLYDKNCHLSHVDEKQNNGSLEEMGEGWWGEWQSFADQFYSCVEAGYASLYGV